MGTSGSTTGVPVSSGVGVSVNSALALPWTHLSLSRYAKIMGINPAHFHRSHAPSINPSVFPINTCSNVWPRFSWQNNDQVSHEELAYAIQSAEQDIINLVGYFPSPDWVEQEVHDMPRDYDRQYYSDGLDVRGQLKRVVADKRKVILGGKRAVSLVGTATVAGGTLVYQDIDGDGVEEVAVINLPTTLTTAGEIKVYFAGFGGARDWEVRPVKYRVIAGGFVTIRLDSWLLVDPELLSAYPTDSGFRAIDISTTANYVTSVDVYREYNDNTVYSAEFVWQGVELPDATLCLDSNYTLSNAQSGVMLVTDGPDGLVMPVPGTYSAATSQWLVSAWTEGIMPDYVRLYYYSGEYANEYLRGFSTDPLSDWWAQIICWIATARLTRPFCGCSSPSDMAEKLSEDLSLSESGRGHFTPVELMRNPLGSRRGEVMAWRRLSRLMRDRRATFAVI